MKPYDAPKPQVKDEQSWRLLLVGFVAGALLLGGVVIYQTYRLRQMQRAEVEALMRAQLAENQALRAQQSAEAAAERQQELNLQMNGNPDRGDTK